MIMIKMNNERNKDEHEHTFTTIKAKPVTLKENYDYFGKSGILEFLHRLLQY